jgi:hypothetical protein
MKAVHGQQVLDPATPSPGIHSDPSLWSVVLLIRRHLNEHTIGCALCLIRHNLLLLKGHLCNGVEIMKKLFVPLFIRFQSNGMVIGLVPGSPTRVAGHFFFHSRFTEN